MHTEQKQLDRMSFPTILIEMVDQSVHILCSAHDTKAIVRRTRSSTNLYDLLDTFPWIFVVLQHCASRDDNELLKIDHHKRIGCNLASTRSHGCVC